MAGQQFGGTAPGMMPPSGYSNGPGGLGLSPLMQRPQFDGTPIPQIPQFGVAEPPPQPQNQPQMRAQAGTAYNSVMPPIGGNRVFIDGFDSNIAQHSSPSSQSSPSKCISAVCRWFNWRNGWNSKRDGFQPSKRFSDVCQCSPSRPWGFRRHLYHRLDITRH
jgi:hypothetical protein